METLLFLAGLIIGCGVTLWALRALRALRGLAYFLIQLDDIRRGDD
jgi:hypothetical protein